MNPATAEELRTITLSRMLQDHRVVFAGVGAPLVASALAFRLHAPHLTVVLEGGIIGVTFRDGSLPVSTNEMRAAFGAPMLTDINDVFLYAQGGFFDYGVLGAGQIDRFGNINSSIIGHHDHPTVRLPGSGGANDIASLCNTLLIVTSHESRRFVEKVDFVTSTGWVTGGTARADAGLARGGPSAVVTELAVFDFHPVTKEMRLCALQQGVTIDEVRERTGFELTTTPDVGVIDAPTNQELETLRRLTGTVVAG
jgi:glutaconate CoA-transferase, subunit B